MEEFAPAVWTSISAALRVWWGTASRTLRIFTVGGAAVGVSILLMLVGGPDRAVTGLLASGGLLLTAAFLLDLYHAALRAWEWPLGKVVGTLGATMVAAVSMALASVIIKESTGLDPGQLSYAVTFLAPLTAGFLLTVATMAIVLAVFAWFVLESLWGVLLWMSGARKDARPVNSDKVLIRLVGVMALGITNAVLFDIGQRPYNGLLSTTARYFTYGLEMYPNDRCALGGERVRRLSDEVVAAARMTDKGLVFEQRRCALADVAQVDPRRPSLGEGGQGLSAE